MMDIARGHWTIENGNHYVRDRTYDEDRRPDRDPNSARILSTLLSADTGEAIVHGHHVAADPTSVRDAIINKTQPRPS